MSYPVIFQADYVERQSRLTSFFRWFLSIPWGVVAFIWMIGAMFGVFVAWFAILFTGRYPAFAYNLVTNYLRYSARVSGWALLMTDVFPPFDCAEHPEYPIRLVIPEPQAEYSRVKTLFRIILMIPVLIMIYLFNALAGIVHLLLWVVILFTGKAPRGLWDIMLMSVAYIIRGNAYHLLVTETYPPLSADDGAAPTQSTAPPAQPSPFGG